jgi:hypothetical protein
VISDRQWKLENEYKYKKGDQATSIFFEKIYEIGIAFFFVCIIFLASREHVFCVTNFCFPWPPVLIVLAIPLLYIYRAILGRNESWADKGRRESHKTAILVKTKDGSYVSRFRKDSYINLMNSSIKCKVCKQKFKTESDLERYFMICTENNECTDGLARASGKKPADFRP